MEDAQEREQDEQRDTCVFGGRLEPGNDRDEGIFMGIRNSEVRLAAEGNLNSELALLAHQ